MIPSYDCLLCFESKLKPIGNSNSMFCPQAACTGKFRECSMGDMCLNLPLMKEAAMAKNLPAPLYPLALLNGISVADGKNVLGLSYINPRSCAMCYTCKNKHRPDRKGKRRADDQARAPSGAAGGKGESATHHHHASCH